MPGRGKRSSGRRRRLKRALVILIAWFLAPGGVATCQPRPVAGDSLDAWIGQMIMVGFRGCVLEADDPILSQIRDLDLGGVVLFDYDVPLRSPVRNIESPGQVRRLVRTLQSAARTPLLVAIDQEGGRIARLKPSRGFPATRSEAYLGALDNEDSTRTNARLIATTLRALGINVNFAPVLDLALNPDNPVIARLERSYGRDPGLVTRHGRWTVEEFHGAGVASAVKHFPGHGSSREDSHVGLPDVTAYWSPVELNPFAALISEDLPDMVMIAHLFNRKWDAIHPATLSRAVVTGMLRDSLGFGGVVVTDDLQMKAIRGSYDLAETVKLAVLAGADILLFANNSIYDPAVAEKTFRIVKDLVGRGIISRERVMASYNRIMRLKERLKRGWDHVPE